MKPIVFLLSVGMLWQTEILAQGFGCDPSGTLQQRRDLYDQRVGFLNEGDLLPYDPSQNPSGTQSESHYTLFAIRTALAWCLSLQYRKDFSA